MATTTHCFLYPKLHNYKTNNFIFINSFLKTTKLHPSMLRKLNFSPSLRHFLVYNQQKIRILAHPLNKTSKFPLFSPLIHPKIQSFERGFTEISMANQESASSSSQTHKYTNRLALEHSPYLLQHAHNPVCATSSPSLSIYICILSFLLSILQ